VKRTGCPALLPARRIAALAVSGAFACASIGPRAALAQAAPQPAASATDPGGAPPSERYIPLAPVPVTPSMLNLPERNVERVGATARLAHIGVDVDRDAAPADGQTPVHITVRLTDVNGVLLTGRRRITVRASGGRIRLPDAGEEDTGARRENFDRVSSGIDIQVDDGIARFQLLAPYEPKDVELRVAAEGLEAVGLISFVPELRELIATGVIDGNIAREHGIASGVSNDQLENELDHFQRTFDEGKGDIGARAEFFLKGVIKGEYLLTVAYDSDRAALSPLFRDIRPEEFYPVYGDASLKGFDAQTTQKLYVRIDHDHSFILYGDFNTGSVVSRPGSLGTYSRSLTGLDGHYEVPVGVVDGFASHGATQQVIDEQPSRGTSGPYYVSNLNGIRNSEKVEIVTRDRNQPSVILSVEPMTRFVDYTFDPFAGQILFMQPVPTVDSNFNPITIRITYEVEGGGPNYYVFGASGQTKLNDAVSVGGSYAQDDNPVNRYRLESVNGTVKFDENTSLFGEFAHSALNQGLDPILTSPYNPVESGSGERIEARHNEGPWEFLFSAGRTDLGFYNPSATMVGGRTEVTARTSYQVDPDLKVSGELLDSEDGTSGAKRTGGQIYTDYKLNDIFTLETGIRRSNDKIGSLDGEPVAVNAYAAGITNTPLGQSYTPYQANSPQLQNAPALTDSTSLRLKLTAQLSEKSQVYGEVERDIVDADKERYAFGADYQIAEGTRVYARQEWSSSSSGPYGLDQGGRDTLTSVGIDQTYMKDGQIFSEYRLRDTEDERDALAAMGVRNLWTLSPGVRVTTSFERQNVLFNSSTSAAASGSVLPQSQSQSATPPPQANPLAAAGAGLGSVTSLPSATPLSVPYTTGAATSLTGGLELTYDPTWKAAARLELRQDPLYDSVLSTLAYSTKLDRDWSLITRNYLNYMGARSSDSYDQYDERIQIGAAFRPVDDNRFSGLARYELRMAENMTPPDAAREQANIFSVAGTYHPTRRWWFSSRVAAEYVADNFSGVHSTYSAYLVGVRAVYDITPRWDIGATENVLFSPEGSARQYAIGLEVGYLLKENLWASAGYNFVGFSNRDLVGSDYTNRGVYVRLRYKFDEDLFAAQGPVADSAANGAVGNSPVADAGAAKAK
jgi:hypothetical protein